MELVLEGLINYVTVGQSYLSSIVVHADCNSLLYPICITASKGPDCKVLLYLPVLPCGRTST